MTAGWLVAATQTRVREPIVSSPDFMPHAPFAATLPIYLGLRLARSMPAYTVRSLVYVFFQKHILGGSRGSVVKTDSRLGDQSSILCVTYSAIVRKGIWPYYIPRYRLSTFGRRAFSVAGPTIRNSLPGSLHDLALSSNSFRQSLKMNLFGRYHSAHAVP